MAIKCVLLILLRLTKIHKYIFVLCAAFRFHKITGRYPKINWLKLPSLDNARWNSRATYALISYFLIPKWRIALEAPCPFIANAWQEAWFSNQIFKEDVYDNFLQWISQLNFPAALTSFTTHWRSEKFILNIQRTNICAERALKLMEELLQKCKGEKYLTLKFISTNKFWMTLLITPLIILILFVLIICYIMSKIIFLSILFSVLRGIFFKMKFIRNLLKKVHLVQLQAKNIFSSHNPSICFRRMHS